MIGIVIIGHGQLGREFLETVEFILGPQPRCVAISVSDSDDRKSKAEEIQETAASLDDGSGVILVMDVVGSSPAKLARAALKERNRIGLYGANMPMLLTLARARHVHLAEAARLALDAGRKYIDRSDPNGENNGP